MNFCWTFALLSAMTGADDRPLAPHPDVHKNHVRKASAEYLASFRRITWHYDFATAAALARETGRPMFVIFCRAGSIDDPRTGEPKCAS